MKTEIGQTRKCLWRASIRETPFSRGLIFSWFLPLHSALSHYYNSRPPPPLSRPPTTAHHPLSMLPGAHVACGHSFRDALLPHGLLLPSQGGNLGERRPGASSPPLSRGLGGIPNNLSRRHRDCILGPSINPGSALPRNCSQSRFGYNAIKHENLFISTKEIS